MGVHLALLPIFIALLALMLSYVRPRVKDALVELAEEVGQTVDEEVVGPNASRLSFGEYRSWHQIVHSLDRRMARLTVSMNVSFVTNVVGAITSALFISLNLYKVPIGGHVEFALDILSGTALLLAVLGTIEPCYLIFNRARR